MAFSISEERALRALIQAASKRGKILAGESVQDSKSTSDIVDQFNLLLSSLRISGEIETDYVVDADKNRLIGGPEEYVNGEALQYDYLVGTDGEEVMNKTEEGVSERIRSA